MSFEPTTNEQRRQHEEWKKAKQRLAEPVLLKPRLVVTDQLTTKQAGNEIRREIMDYTIAAVANAADLAANEILSGAPTTDICSARNLAMALCVLRQKLAIQDVANYFEVHAKAVKNATYALDFIFIDLSVSTRTPLEIILKSVWPRWNYRPGGVLIEDVQTAVCVKWGINESDLISQRRHKDLVTARHAAMAIVKNLTAKSYPEIGKAFGNRDHTSVLHAVRKFDVVMSEASKVLNRDSSIAQWVNCIYDKLQYVTLSYDYGKGKRRA